MRHAGYRCEAWRRANSHRCSFDVTNVFFFTAFRMMARRGGAVSLHLIVPALSSKCVNHGSGVSAARLDCLLLVPQLFFMKLTFMYLFSASFLNTVLCN